MSSHPLSHQEKVIQAIVLWLPACLFSIPLWDLASMLLQALLAGRLAHALMEVLLNPLGTILWLMVFFRMVAEDGVGAIISHYWPAPLIATAFTAFVLSRWWRHD